jgi:TolB-like protein/Tfp pilus assembly protein PilF
VASDKPGFLEELKRRHVVRVAIAYAVAGWLLVQVATQVFPFFNVPNWAVRLVVILLAIGFPVAVAFAWIYELTPEGIRRTEAAGSPGARSEHANRQIGRKLNTLIIAVLVLAVALLGWRLYAVRHQTAAPIAAAAASSTDEVKRNPGVASAIAPASTTGAAASGLPDAAGASGASVAAIPAKSVAVLPFANEGEKSEQFFSDGLSEDLITALSQFAGLKVISRNSAFQFRDSKDTSAEIGKLLGVAHLLEGSVQRADDEVRITATLVNAGDGTVLWTQRYDKPYKDLFALQDDITHSVADALKAKLLTAPGAVVQSDRPPSGNLAAYAAYQRGQVYSALDTETSTHQAIDAFDAAIRLDPKYAAAYAQLSKNWSALAVQFPSGAAEIAQAKDAAREASATALKLDPDSSLAHLAHANLLTQFDMDWTGAEAEYRRTLQLAPNDAAAQFGLGNALAVQGQCRRAVELIRQALASDPRHAKWYSWLSVYLAGLGQPDEAKQAIETAITLQLGGSVFHEQLAIAEILRGDADNTFKWLDRAWTNRDPGINNLLLDPFILRYRDDPRFAAFCKKVGLPATTDAVAMKP